jgi:hypothetical protein
VVSPGRFFYDAVMAIDSIEFDVNPILQKLDRMQRLEVPFAASLALNRVGASVKERLQMEMKSVFNNPVPFTLNSLYIKASTKTNLEVEIGFRDFAPKGNPAVKYTGPQIYGGAAYDTRFQKSLKYNGILAPNMYAIPTQSDFLRMNQYGNVTPGQYTEILYALKSFRDSTAFVYREKAKKKRATEYFAITTKTGRLYPGIYRTKVPKGYEQDRAVFWFRRTPTYTGKFKFFDVAKGHAGSIWNKEFGRALSQAIASQKI